MGERRVFAFRITLPIAGVVVAMNRRRLLASIGAGSVVGLAGCLGDATPLDDQDGGNTTTGGPESTTPESAGPPCPPVETARESAICSHTADPATTAVYLEPEPSRTTLRNGTPSDEITLAFYNQSSTELTFNPHSWRIWHTTDTEWTELQQELAGDGHLTVSPDDTHSWTFTEAVESIQENPALAPGRYAVELGVPDPENSDAWIACIALVHLDQPE